MPDGANPVFDKELRSEIFSQGTLMLRLVVQVSMFLALPLMAFCLYWKVDLAPWYIAYVLLFNVLVGPVFSAGSVTSERERQTLDLLLTTIISPFQILWGKLIAGLRVSSVLTSFLVWPVLLAWAMGSFGWENVLSVPAYLGGDLADLPDDGHGRAVLLGAVSQDGHEHDDELLDHRRALLPAAGAAVLRSHLFSASRGDCVD